MILSLLVAADETNVIGIANKLPWHLPADLTYFKNLTWGLPIVMGRKTFDSIGKPLPGRTSIVITRNRDWRHDGVVTVHSVDDAIARAEELAVKEIFVIGGAEIFHAALPKAFRIYLTRIGHRFEGDVFFPAVTPPEWTLVRETAGVVDDRNQYPHRFQVWERTGLNP
ncbi:MAG: dihydrofolate reductase [Flaviaesturariibacter sp.]|nr:dihydrofolate reductase [Flaviaesturariibacter sp.]